jgi:hypothetical protein
MAEARNEARNEVRKPGYIEREYAIQLLEEHMTDAVAESKTMVKDIYLMAKNHAKEYLSIIPAADVVEVRHGEWGKEAWMHTHQHICSLCFSTVRVHPESCEYRYCPYCGAKMDGERKE